MTDPSRHGKEIIDLINNVATGERAKNLLEYFEKNPLDLEIMVKVFDLKESSKLRQESSYISIQEDDSSQCLHRGC